ncbi:hypothetical protein [Moorena producens]|uniref:hypothetical protein n=1 Tax=Moorena producens TaxID=1155739 RepID=UPI0011EA712E|nr:hypothetical protein [Moorena producens]
MAKRPRDRVWSRGARCSVRAATRSHSGALPVHGQTDLSSYTEGNTEAYPFSARVNASQFVLKVTYKR